MRIDLTVRSDDGRDHDLAVSAPQGTTWREVEPAVTAAVPNARPAWSGRRRLHPGLLLGRLGLATGSVLTAAPRPDGDDGPGAWLEVIGGARAGAGVPIRSGDLDLGRGARCALALSDPRVSRRHAVVTATTAGLRVRDLGSTHGTTIDGVPVEGITTFTPGAVLRLGDTFVTVREPSSGSASVRESRNGPALVSRSSRTPERLDDRIIEIPRPTATRLVRARWGAALLPAAAGVGLAWAMHSVQFLAFAALTPLTLAATAVGDRLHWRRDRRRAAATLRARRARAEDAIAAGARLEVRQRHAADPDPAEVARIARIPGARLWHRRRGQPELLRLRIGLGDAPSALRADRDGVVGAATVLPAVPITVDLRRGALGVAAPLRVRIGLARWLIVQLATLTSPADVELALLLADGRAWSWVRWLPHLRARVACTDAEQAALVDELSELVDRRATGRARESPWPGGWVIVLVDRPASAAIAQLGALLLDGPSVGITAVCLADRVQALPLACAHAVYAIGDTGGTVRVGPTDVIADRVEVAWAERLARALAPLGDAEADPGAALPAECRLVELLGPDWPTATGIAEAWARDDGRAGTVLGVGTDGPITIDLDRDGPHVLVAGTTGSGKSELLQALVLGLAGRHPPEEITFLLVDYKGGAAFADCARLPHTVGLVTDLDEHLTRRVLASLDSELRRRERLLAAAAAPDRSAYRALGESLPRLVLVVDEFAALAQELPAFVSGLVGIAQRGRSLGLHLVLATQRPAGVVSAEIRANTALRIALRVTSVADSTDVVDGPEAAAIDRRTPGRAFLRAGVTSVAFQAARVSGSLAPDERVRVTRLDSWRRLPSERAADLETDAQRLVATIAAAAADRPAARRPWLPPLPDRVPYGGLAATPPLVVPIGLVDQPSEQRQDLLTIDLGSADTVLIAGRPRSGRTTALLTLALAAAERCSPHELTVHAIDAAGSGLAALAALPHVGTITTARTGCELAARLLHRLTSELAARREALGEGASRPALLLLVDGWEALVSASEEYDGGRTTERLLALLRDAPGAGATVVLTGGRAALAPRVAAAVRSRLVLALPDPGDYAAAGVAASAVPARAGPGRAVRVSDGAELQFAFPGDAPEQRARVASCCARWPDPAPARIRLRALPARVTLSELPPSAGWRLGVGGDAATPITIDLTTGAGRLLVAGPARSGRSTALRLILTQCGDAPLIVAAPARSPLAIAARQRGLTVVGPGDDPPDLPSRGLLLVDDCEAFTASAVAAALTGWLRDNETARAVIAGRSDALAIAVHDLSAEIRACGHGLLLRPGPLDGDLLGVRLPRTRTSSVPGRGVLVPDPAWQLGDQPLPIQLADSPSTGPAQPMCG